MLSPDPADGLNPFPVDEKENDVSHLPEPTSRPEPTMMLRARFRASELDRRISSLEFMLGYVRWLFLPVLIIALITMMVGLILGMGSPAPVIGGIVAIAGATASLFRKAGGIGEDIGDAKRERDSCLALLHSEAEDPRIASGEE